MGFRKGGDLWLVSSRKICEKALEHGRELDMIFVNQEKALDRVDRKKLAYSRRIRGEGHTSEYIKAMYENSMQCVRTSEGKH